MNIALGCDHRGFAHKVGLLEGLADLGHVVMDYGCPSTESADYPDAAFAVAEAVARGDAERGILICGSGIGMSIAANKVRGIRAALCCDEDAARMTAQHNDSNVLCLSGDRFSPDQTLQISEAWLSSEFAGDRHAVRVQKIQNYEEHHSLPEEK